MDGHGGGQSSDLSFFIMLPDGSTINVDDHEEDRRGDAPFTSIEASPDENELDVNEDSEIAGNGNEEDRDDSDQSDDEREEDLEDLDEEADDENEEDLEDRNDSDEAGNRNEGDSEDPGEDSNANEINLETKRK